MTYKPLTTPAASTIYLSEGAFCGAFCPENPIFIERSFRVSPRETEGFLTKVYPEGTFSLDEKF